MLDARLLVGDPGGLGTPNPRTFWSSGADDRLDWGVLFIGESWVPMPASPPRSPCLDGRLFVGESAVAPNSVAEAEIPRLSFLGHSFGFRVDVLT
jgi:hypothetical protein